MTTETLSSMTRITHSAGRERVKSPTTQENLLYPREIGFIHEELEVSSLPGSPSRSVGFEPLPAPTTASDRPILPGQTISYKHRAAHPSRRAEPLERYGPCVEPHNRFSTTEPCIGKSGRGDLRAPKSLLQIWSSPVLVFEISFSLCSAAYRLGGPHFSRGFKGFDGSRFTSQWRFGAMIRAYLSFRCGFRSMWPDQVWTSKIACLGRPAKAPRSHRRCLAAPCRPSPPSQVPATKHRSRTSKMSAGMDLGAAKEFQILWGDGSVYR
ncbi:hypothetical protein U1Q18_004285 [Sarracenia purpurea var. burkii]